MKKITYLATAIAFFSFASLDATAQTDKSKNKSKKKHKVEQTTDVETETQADTQTQAIEQTQPAAEQQTQPAPQAQQDNMKREAITQEELPEPVKQALAAEAFSSWQVVEAFRLTPNASGANANTTNTANQGMESNAGQTNTNAATQGQGAATVYEIMFTNEQQQSAKVRIDELGNIIRDQK